MTPVVVMTACPDCGGPLEGTDRMTAGWWCHVCRKYYQPPIVTAPQPGVVWMVRDPATCPACPCPGDVLQLYATRKQAAEYTARQPRRVLVIEKWDVPGHE